MARQASALVADGGVGKRRAEVLALDDEPRSERDEDDAADRFGDAAKDAAPCDRADGQRHQHLHEGEAGLRAGEGAAAVVFARGVADGSGSIEARVVDFSAGGVGLGVPALPPVAFGGAALVVMLGYSPWLKRHGPPGNLAVAAVAVWASSGMTFPHGQAEMNRALYKELFSSSHQGSKGAEGRLGEAIRRAKAATGDADVRRTWILLGDPTMRPSH